MKKKAIENGDLVPMSDKKFDSGDLDGILPWEMEQGVIEDMEYLNCPDIKCPYVAQGQGFPVGLSEREHTVWAQKQDHLDVTAMENIEVDRDFHNPKWVHTEELANTW